MARARDSAVESAAMADLTRSALHRGTRSALHRGAAMKRVSLVVALGIFVIAGVRASAQAPAPANNFPQTFTNLQVWPKDTSPAVIQQFMNAFGDSLGITCDYCHVKRADGKFDFASDDKREKVVAR